MERRKEDRKMRMKFEGHEGSENVSTSRRKGAKDGK